MSEAGRRGPVDLRLLHLVPALRRHLAVVGVVAAVTAVAVVVQADLLADALTDLVDDGNITALGRFVGALAAVALVRGGAVAVTEWSAGQAMAATRLRVLDAVLDHAARDADRATSGIASREATIATTGADELEPYVRQFLPALMLAVAVPLVAGARILTADLLSAVLVAVTVPLIPVFMVLIGRMTERRTQRQWSTLQRLGGHFLDVIEGLPTLRLFGRAEAQRASVHSVSEQYRATTMGALRIAFLSAFALELIATLSVALIAVEIGLRLAAGSFELQPALVILILAPECYFPIRRVGASFHAAQTGLDASEDLHELLDRPILPTGDRPAPPVGTVELRGVELRRAGRTVVEGLDLDLESGSVVAVHGSSGVGKSTLIEAVRGRLLDRHGSIRVGGVDLDDIDPDAWADRLAVIGQRLTPSRVTVLDAVRSGSDVSPKAIEDAIASVGLSEVATPGRRIEELSGGQLRRVQVARAIVAVRSGRASIVLADEPTAHLDTESANLVWQAIRTLARDDRAAVLVATHDPSGRGIADRVVELTATEDGGTETLTDWFDVVDVLDEVAAETREFAVSLPPQSTDVTERSSEVAPRGASPATPGSRRSEQWNAVRRVMTMARPARRRFLGAGALGIAAEVCTLGLAAFAAWLIVRASGQPDLAELSLAILAVRAFGTGKGVFRYAERLATHDAGLRALSEIRAATVDRLARIAPAGIPGWERGDLLQRVVADIDRLLDLFVRVLGPIVAIAVTTTSAVAITLWLDVDAGIVLASALFVVGIVVPVATVVGESTIGPRVTDLRARFSGRVLDHTEHLDETIADRTAATDRRGVVELLADRSQVERRRTRLRATTGALIAAAPLATVIATLLVVNGSTIDAAILGVLVLWPLAVIELAGTTNEAAATLPTVAASAARVMAVLDTPDPNPAPATHLERLGRDEPPTVDVADLTARWPTSRQAAVGPVSFRLPPAGHCTIVGPSGSGKSTLAAVLVGFLPPSTGTYRLDGIDALDVDGLRDTVTWIQQLPWLADSTVRENLRIADPTAADDTLLDVVAAVRLDRWLQRLPHGLDTHVGRGGAAMSGGEAQRLALARVLLAGHRVVVLDEPTANLDRVTAAAVLSTVLERCADRSTVVLGHRPPR